MPATIKRDWYLFPLFRWVYWRRERVALAPVTVTKTVAYNTTGIATGVLWFRLPSKAVVTDFSCDVTTAFNATTTNVLTVGHGASLNEFAAAGDIDESSVTLQALTPPDMIAADKDIYIKYTQSGTAASAGAAAFSLTYAPYE